MNSILQPVGGRTSFPRLVVHIESPWLTSTHLENGLSRSWALEDPGEECDSERYHQVGPQPPKPHPAGVAAGQGGREGGPGASPSLPFSPAGAGLCQPGLSHGRPHPARLVGASYPAVLQGAPHFHGEAAQVPRISSPSPKSRDYLSPPRASLVWLCFPLQSHSGLLEQQVNQHAGEVILHCRTTRLFQETHVCVDVEALFLQNLARCVPAFTLVLHCPANLYQEQLPALQGCLSSAPVSTWYGTG